MQVHINDANILIDLVHIGLHDYFLNMEGYQFKTTDFVLDELNQNQKETLEPFTIQETLQVLTSSVEDMYKIKQLQDSTTGLSFEDCSVWYYAKKTAGILLTGDAKLRKQARQDGVQVNGILYVFDLLLLNHRISLETAIEKIELLYTLNTRLPIDEKLKRLDIWGRSLL